MQKIVYNIGVGLYYWIAFLMSPFNKKANLWIEGRKKPIEQVDGNSIWFHCASLGEFEQARPLLEKIKEEYKDYKIVLSFFSPSGYEIRKNYAFADFVYYLPNDTNKNAENFIQKINPKLVFFIKYEFWFHFSNVLKKQNIPLILVSGIFRKNQIIFKKFGGLFREILENFSYFFVQDSHSKELLNSIGINKVRVSSDLRHDRVYDIFQESKVYPLIEEFKGNSKTIILGSSWKKDEIIFSEILNSLENYKIIIAPHDIHKSRILEVTERFPQAVLYSELNSKHREKQILIIDNIGMLSSIYKYSDIAYVGGGFGKSIHNILEAVVFSIPVIFGPAHTKMKEALDLLENRGAFTINNATDLKNILNDLSSRNNLLESGKKAGDYVQTNLGGTEIIMEHLKKEKILS